jgi:UDP-N-acetylglucosamine--N-acetylmuramyl-(pentapeptide) pyrophosphoryl-undecaprenol N-acetylglucosamine transferase
MLAFLQRMDYAYAAADLIISRAGAGTISELCVVGKPVILCLRPMWPKTIRPKMQWHWLIKMLRYWLRIVMQKDLVPAALNLLKDAAHIAQLSEILKTR